MTNLALGETDKSMQQLRHIDLGFVRVLKHIQCNDLKLRYFMREEETPGETEKQRETL